MKECDGGEDSAERRRHCSTEIRKKITRFSLLGSVFLLLERESV